MFRSIEAVKPTRPSLSSFLARRSIRVPIASSKKEDSEAELFKELKKVEEKLKVEKVEVDYNGEQRKVLDVDPARGRITLEGVGTLQCYGNPIASKDKELQGLRKPGDK